MYHLDFCRHQGWTVGRSRPPQISIYRTTRKLSYRPALRQYKRFEHRCHRLIEDRRPQLTMLHLVMLQMDDRRRDAESNG